jgi:hypothetical protein
LYKWRIYIDSRIEWDIRYAADQRMYRAGFTTFEYLGLVPPARDIGDTCGGWFHYTTTHKSRSAMMMHMLKHSKDISMAKEHNDV